MSAANTKAKLVVQIEFLLLKYLFFYYQQGWINPVVDLIVKSTSELQFVLPQNY